MRWRLNYHSLLLLRLRFRCRWSLSPSAVASTLALAMLTIVGESLIMGSFIREPAPLSSSERVARHRGIVTRPAQPRVSMQMLGVLHEHEKMARQKDRHTVPPCRCRSGRSSGPAETPFRREANVLSHPTISVERARARGGTWTVQSVLCSDRSKNRQVEGCDKEWRIAEYR